MGNPCKLGDKVMNSEDTPLICRFCIFLQAICRLFAGMMQRVCRMISGCCDICGIARNCACKGVAKGLQRHCMAAAAMVAPHVFDGKTLEI